MTQKEKQVLLQYLSAALPYGVKGQCEIDASYDTSFDTIFQIHKFDANLDGIKEGLLFVTPLIENNDEQEFANEEVADGIDILDFKPYLRPMSSMTEEEKKEYYETMDKYTHRLYPNSADFSEHTEYSWTAETFDWFNRYHFDYRGLIEKGLAIEVNKSNNPYEN